MNIYFKIFVIKSILLICIPASSQEKLKCYQCSGEPECSTKLVEKFLKPCTNEVAADACFEYVKEDSTMVRGCKSDPIYKECQNEGCIECTTPGCNNLLTTLKKPELACHKCVSKNDPSCLWTRRDENVDRCQKLLPKYVLERCYVKRFDDGSYRRGCANDDDICSQEDEANCTMCDSNGCNKLFVQAQQCIQAVEDISVDLEIDVDKQEVEVQVKVKQAARSNTINDLLSNDVAANVTGNRLQTTSHAINERQMVATNRTRTPCGAEDQFYENRGCYVAKKDSKLIWGCVVDLMPDEVEICKTNSTICKMCTGSACNSLSEPGGKENAATAVKMTSVAVALCFIISFVCL